MEMSTVTRLLLVVSLILVVVACGDSVVEPAEPVDLDVKMTDELVYEPGEITVARGAELTITAQNESSHNAKHDLVIISGVFSELVDAKNAPVVAQMGLIPAGESESLVVTFDKPGEYQFFCTVQGHFVAGMHGTITVDG